MRRPGLSAMVLVGCSIGSAAACSGSKFDTMGSVAGAGGAAGAQASSEAGAAGSPDSGGEAPTVGGTCSVDDRPRCRDAASLQVCEAPGKWVVRECPLPVDACAAPSCLDGACVVPSATAFDEPGDCRKQTCKAGAVIDEVDPNDAPAARGVCDVPYCSEAGEPGFETDPAKCEVTERCAAGECQCLPCPNGVVAALSPALCRTPKSVVAMANTATAAGPASAAVDGLDTTSWNSGTYDGVLTVELPTPQALSSIVLYMGGAHSGMLKRVVNVQATVTRVSGADLTQKGAFEFETGAPPAPLRLEFEPLTATKLTFSFASQATWISVHEVLFSVCD